jgi:hypothetical protein
LTLVAEGLRVIIAALEVPEIGVVVVVAPLPPQLASTKVIAATVKAARDLMWFV